jgi:hypothetical protein
MVSKDEIEARWTHPVAEVRERPLTYTLNNQLYVLADKQPFSGSTLAYVEFSGLNIINSRNIDSIADLGVGEYHFTFADDYASDAYGILPLKTTPRNFEITEQTAGGFSVRFLDGDPEYAGFKVISAE